MKLMLIVDTAEGMAMKATLLMGGKAHVYIDCVGSGSTLGAGVALLEHVICFVIYIDIYYPDYTFVQRE